jgi:hypothetical protein
VNSSVATERQSEERQREQQRREKRVRKESTHLKVPLNDMSKHRLLPGAFVDPPFVLLGCARRGRKRRGRRRRGGDRSCSGGRGSESQEKEEQASSPHTACEEERQLREVREVVRVVLGPSKLLLVHLLLLQSVFSSL